MTTMYFESDDAVAKIQTTDPAASESLMQKYGFRKITATEYKNAKRRRPNKAINPTPDTAASGDVTPATLGES